jgi:NAD(P)H-flavin reductase
VHKSKNKEFKITGPIGRGCEVNEDIYGEVFLICGGTGILPFIDLLDILYKKACFLAL